MQSLLLKKKSVFMKKTISKSVKRIGVTPSGKGVRTEQVVYIEPTGKKNKKRKLLHTSQTRHEAIND